MKIIKSTVSRREASEIDRLHAEARAKIALHHFCGFTDCNPILSRLLAGLERRKLISRRPSWRS
jgi:hypothetical protein